MSYCGDAYEVGYDKAKEESHARIAELERERDSALRELRAIRWLQKTHPTGFDLLGPEYVGLVGVDADDTEHLTYSSAAEAMGWEDDDG